MKWIKYLAIVILILLTVMAVLFNRTGVQIYGGLTEKVDHTQFKPQSGSFVITNVNILAEDGESMIPERNVLIRDGKIEQIVSDSITFSYETVIDGEGKFLIPGLIDSHVHLFKSPNDLLLYLANGVTEIREMIGEKDHLKWKKEIDNGRVGPKMFVASPRLGTFEDAEGFFMSLTQGYMNVPNAEAADKIVEDLHKKGYDGIKIYSQLSKESYVAISKKANELGMPFFGHLPWHLELSDVLESGQKGIAHFEEIMNAFQREFDPENDSHFGSFHGREEEFLAFVKERCSGLAEQLIQNDISVTSTLWLTESFVRQKFELDQVLSEVALAYQNPGISEWVSFIPEGLGWLPEVNRYKLPSSFNEKQRESSKRYWDCYGKACAVIASELSKLGVTILAGTDANLPPTVPGFSFHDELKSLSNAGMSNAAVLKSATSSGADWLASDSGQITEGRIANLVLLNKNPLEDIGHTKSIDAVFNKGELFDRALLDAMLSAVAKANEKSRKVDISSYLN